MRATRWLRLIALFCLALAVSTVRAEAVSSTFSCTVNQAGPSGTEVRIMLSDNSPAPTFANKWFKAPVGQENRMLAIAVSAMINKKKVNVVVDPELPSPPEISALYFKP
jgi:hypothetical protein